MVADNRHYQTLFGQPVLAIVLAVAFASGCGQEAHSPTAPEPAAPAVTNAPDTKVYLVFSPQALVAAKVTDDDDDDESGFRSVSKTAKPHKRTKLRIKEDDDLRVVLKIPKRAVNDDVLVTMGLWPASLSMLVIELGPSGLYFNLNKDAELRIDLDEDLVDIPLADLEALVVSEHGLVANATLVSVETHGDDDDGDDDDGDDDGDDGSSGFESITIKIAVPHFSRYGLRNSSGHNTCPIWNVHCFY